MSVQHLDELQSRRFPASVGFVSSIQLLDGSLLTGKLVPGSRRVIGVPRSCPSNHIDEHSWLRDRHGYGHCGWGLTSATKPELFLGLLIQLDCPSHVPQPLMVAGEPSVSVGQKKVHLRAKHPRLRGARKPHEHVCGREIPAKLPQ
jgi:hypothetical protein